MPTFYYVLAAASLLTFAPRASGQTPAGAPADTAAGFRVSGTLADGAAPVGYANVLLMHAADSTLALAEFSGDDGGFALRADSGRYFLQVVMLGYDDYQGPAFTLDADRDLGAIALGSAVETLATATVSARKPFLEQQAGKLVVNVENAITGQTGSATQLLRKVPGLIVRQGNVSMAGSSGVTILIDGKPTRYMDVNALLRDLPASDIARVEVVSQPGATYDAEGGGGIVNIILKKNVRLGTNGSAQLGVGRGDFDKLNASLQLSHRDGPLNAYGTASYRRGSGYERLEFDRIVGGERILQDNYTPYLPNSASLRGGVDYDLSERTTVGVSGRYQHTRDDATGTNASVGYGASEIGAPLAGLTPRYRVVTANVDDQRKRTYGADAFYRFAIDSAGRKLEADASYGGYRRDGEKLATPTLERGTFAQSLDDIRNAETGRTDIGAAQVDYTHPLTLAGHADSTERALTLKTGAKYAFADVDAELLAARRAKDAGGVWRDDANLSNRFLYAEDIAAAYLSADLLLGGVSLNAGLRYEHTFVTGDNVTIDSSYTRDYGGWFPSAGLSVPLGGSLGVSAAYSYRLTRPDYGDLNPFVTFLDPLTLQRGNTELTPEYTHSAQASLTYDGEPFFRLAYERTADAITLVTEQDAETGVTEAYDANLDRYTRYGGHLFAPLSFVPGVDGYLGGMAYYNLYESDFLGGDFDQGAWAFTGFFSATVDLPLELKMELGGWYQRGGQEGILQSGDVYGSSVGIERKFLDDRLTVALSVEDPVFDAWDGRIDYLDQRIDIVNTWEQPIAMLNATYKFGNRYVKKAERRESAGREVLERAGED